MTIYLSIVWRLMQRAYRWGARLELKLSSNKAGVYNRFDDISAQRSNLGQLAMQLAGLVLVGAPMVGFIYAVTLLPVSDTAQWAIMTTLAFLAFGIISYHLVQHARKK